MAKSFDVKNFPPDISEVVRLRDFDSSMQPHIETVYNSLCAQAAKVGVFLDHDYEEETPEKRIQEGLLEIERLKPQFLESPGSQQREKIGKYLLTRIAHTEERILTLQTMQELEG